jgi:DNA-binding CsgD family transcriptional regulator
MNRTRTPDKRRQKASTGRGQSTKSGAPRGDASAARKSGIRVLGDMAWGTHFCVFYDTKQDLLDTVISYFQAGLEHNEFCVWAVSGAITMREAEAALRNASPRFERRVLDGQIQLVSGHDWYLKGDQFDLGRITSGWTQKLNEALAMGYDGLRLSGNALWNEGNYWTEFITYEQELDKILKGQKIVALCTYSLRDSSALDILDVARVHQCSIARRNGDWEFLESPELKQAKGEITRLHNALDVLSKPFAGADALTTGERVVLAQIVRGASSKEAARVIGVSPRTIEFHRANIMKKLGAKNTVDLVRKVFDGK